MARPLTSRTFQVSWSYKEYVYVWGGLSDEPEGDVCSHYEKFDSFLEKWDDHPQTETYRGAPPHPGYLYAACTSYEEFVYLYGGRNFDDEHTDVISCLNLTTHRWSGLCAEASGGPKDKIGLRMVYFKEKKLLMVGGYSPHTPTNDHLSFGETFQPW